MPKDSVHPKKGLINIKIIDGNECSKWCLVKITEIYKTEKMNSIAIRVFGYENKKNIQSIHQKNVAKFCRCCLQVFSAEEKLH